MGIKIDIVCGIILAFCSIAGSLLYFWGWLEDNPESLRGGRLWFLLGIAIDCLIYLIYTEFFSSTFPRNNLPFYLLLGVLGVALLLPFVIKEIRAREPLYISEKTEEAPEKSEDIPSDLEGRVEYWHTHDTGNTLQEFLGMTDSEYEKWGRGEYTPAAEDNEKEDK